MSAKDEVLYTEHDDVALIVLNRPKQMNASSVALRAGLRKAIDDADKNPNIRVVILTGEGRGFSAGADLTESFTEHRGTITEHILKDHKQLIDAIEHSDKTFIAAVHGPAAGVMLSYAMACDVIMMGESAYLYSPFTAISLVPDGGGTHYLLQALGYHRAFEFVVEGKRLDAKACLDAGIASALVPDDELRDKAMERAQKIARTSAPLTAKYAKKLLRFARHASRDDVTALEASYQHICSQSEDFQEGVAAFMQKRKPEFKGR